MKLSCFIKKNYVIKIGIFRSSYRSKISELFFGEYELKI